jgi:hypothetical protein
VVLLMAGEEICLLSLIVQTRKVTSDMHFTPQFARHTSTIASRALAVFGGEQFRHWRIQISH